MKNDELLHKWIDGSISSEELEIFKLRPEYESLVDLDKHTSQLSAPTFDEDSMLGDILKKEKIVASPKEPSRRVFLSNWVKYGIAASVLLLATWFFFPRSSSLVSYDLAKGERKEGTLPDQSTFVLNADSKLLYDANDWENNRSLKLNGEAFFEVKKGSTFKVVTQNGTVQVLGTKFNVRSRKKTLEVLCQSGKVAVLDSKGKKIDELNPTDAIRITNDQLNEKWQTQATKKASWVNGISKFKTVPLNAVLEELERQYDITIDANGINVDEIISCNFQHDNIETALKTSLSPLGIEYRINGKIVILNQ